ncbi:MAG: hypothetical protein DYG89_14750 [Caldilinea sp. CFX5]|nr:hypothetical protein [Caldilinea sp. CFX5]
MLDAKLFVDDVEELLDEHYAQLCAQGRKQLEPRVRVYNTPAPAPVAQPAQPPVTHPAASKQLPARPSATPFGEVVANLFVLLMLSVLNQRLSSNPSR